MAQRIEQKRPKVTDLTALNAQKKTKTCTKCLSIKSLSDFYLNQGWTAQNGHDAWCKACVTGCRTKMDAKSYFWENNRKWSENIWESAIKKAQDKLASNSTYSRMNDEQKLATEEKLACSVLPTVMNNSNLYVFEDHFTADGASSPAPHTEEIEEQDDRRPRYSPEFNGYFRKTELEYLRSYYDGLENDFDLSDTNIRDIAKKLAKASLQADKAQNDYMNGRCDYSVVKDAIAQFDLLSKSGNFAACKRKPGDNNGLGSWAEITLRLEQTGHPCTRQIKWEEDDVDRVLTEFRYIAESLSLDTI